MEDVKIIAATISGAVSICIGLLSFYINSLKHQIDSKRLETDLKHKYSEKLLEKRIEVYPQAFACAGMIKKKKHPDKINSSEERNEIKIKLAKWIENDAGLYVSTEVLSTYYVLRDNLGKKGPGGKSELTDDQVEKLWEARNSFRSALRGDLSMLHRGIES